MKSPENPTRLILKRGALQDRLTAVESGQPSNPLAQAGQWLRGGAAADARRLKTQLETLDKLRDTAFSRLHSEAVQHIRAGHARPTTESLLNHRDRVETLRGHVQLIAQIRTLNTKD